MRTALLIFLGGGLGSVARYAVGLVISRYSHGQFPLGTLVVNIAACLLVGLLAGILDYKTSARAFLVIGFCGGFSTFSTFTIEALDLIRGNFMGSAILYILGSLVLCLGSTFVGLWVAARM
jgi:fluoride exporter